MPTMTKRKPRVDVPAVRLRDPFDAVMAIVEDRIGYGVRHAMKYYDPALPTTDEALHTFVRDITEMALDAAIEGARSGLLEALVWPRESEES